MSESLSQSSPPAVTEAITKLLQIAFEEPELGEDGHHNFYNTGNLPKAHREWESKLDAARSRLEGIYREQQQEIVGLRTMIDALQTSHRADLAASLKDSQLTRFEAETVLRSLEKKPFAGPDMDARYDAGEKAISKLRSISSTPAPGNEK